MIAFIDAYRGDVAGGVTLTGEMLVMTVTGCMDQRGKATERPVPSGSFGQLSCRLFCGCSPEGGPVVLLVSSL
ncbi:hypothetical protein ATL40_1681 [Serinibacter salmoneus]|uniref:Uncharacterized protein n=1 Tax=Serinibacter salmoneus TaxID=556530 RepID=A0A2A9D069_9MICO|nr:hypothetical protein ATL40_1681 [Serinibacter salmoneus]